MATKTIYMCSPGAFDVEYNINPWMDGNYHAVNKARAIEQWNSLLTALRATGATVHVLDDVPAECPDAVFIANAGVIFGATLWLSRFRHPERQAEEPFFEREFHRHGWYVMSGGKDSPSFEGAGDALFSPDRDVLWLGTGFRTDLAAAMYLKSLAAVSGAELVTLELVDPSFYHLDTCFCPLDGGHTMWYPAAFSERSQAIIRERLGDKGIQLTEADAYRFSGNAVSVGRTVVLPLSTDELVRRLWDRGYHAVQLDMSQFLKAGGACKCLTLEVVY